jgi:hypothetical protein
MHWPNLCICLLTYDRLQYAERTLRSTLNNVRYSGRLAIHIGDDGSGKEYQDHLWQLAGAFPQVASLGLTDSQRGGYGRNYNLAMADIRQHSSIILPLEDDWELHRPLDLDPLVMVLSDPRVGCIRLGYLGFSAEYLEGKMAHIAGATYFLLDPDGGEHHVFSGHPRLETVEWQRTLGPWPEGLEPGATEFDVCWRRESREGVAWPADLIHPSGDLFGHFGTIKAPELEKVRA